MERTETKNVKLREEVRIKVEQRLQNRQNQLEVKDRQREDLLEDSKKESVSDINNNVEKRSEIKEVINYPFKINI
mgnify:CR=1 FL=1